MPLAIEWHPKRVDGTGRLVKAHRHRSATSARKPRSVRTSHSIGEHQVLIYRSLQSGQNSRAVLGLHTWTSLSTHASPKSAVFSGTGEVEKPE